MKEYDKEKLNEYAKELFALCLDKSLDFEFNIITEKIIIGYYSAFEYIRIGMCFVSKKRYSLLQIQNKTKGNYSVYPIWELIEKVKAL